MSDGRPDRGPRQSRLSGEARREQLLDVTAELVTEVGLDGATMEAVTAKAGVSKALGYVYFANRQDLVLALFDREMAALDAKVVVAMGGAEDLEGRVRATVHAWFDMVATRGRLLNVLLAATSAASPLEDRRRRRQRDVEQTWGEALERDTGLSPAVARSTAAIFIAGSAGALEMWLQRVAPRRQLEELFVRLCMGGVAALAAEAEGASSPAGAMPS